MAKKGTTKNTKKATAKKAGAAFKTRHHVQSTKLRLNHGLFFFRFLHPARLIVLSFLHADSFFHQNYPEKRWLKKLKRVS